MNATILESHIAAALGRDRTPIDSGRTEAGRRSQINVQSTQSTWSADYGAGRPPVKASYMDAARLHDDWGSDRDGVGGPQRKGRMDNRHSWSGKAFWSEMIAALCPGTRNVIIGFGVLMFIVVI